MNHIFWPTDVPLVTGNLLGRRVSSSSICVTGISKECGSSKRQAGDVDDGRPLHIGRVVFPESDIDTAWTLQDEHGNQLQNPILILYTPPNPNRHRFLTLSAISLTPSQPLSAQQVRQLNAIHNLSDSFEGEIGLEAGMEGMLKEALGVVNRCYELRLGGAGKSKSMMRTRVIDVPDVQAGEIKGSSTALKSAVNSLAKISASARQLKLRYTQLSTAYDRWTTIQTELKSNGSLHEVSVRYIRFCNTMWLIVNDLIFGWTLGRLIEHHKNSLLEPIQSIQQLWLVETIKMSLTWMDDWPVGLKLNTPLSGLLCTTFSGMADIWDSIWTSDPDLSHKMVFALSLGSYLGASMFLSVLKDIIGLSTLHLSTISWIMRQVYRAEVSAMYTLWNLFRGKRWNTLRHRVDSFDYEIDQLFLGTLLFTVTIFLLPTIFTYYTFFSLIQIALLACDFAIETALAFINSFPLFALMLRIKEPSRLPGGIGIELQQARKGMNLGPHLMLKNVPLSLGAIFSGFGASWADLSAQYSPARLVVGILTGVV